LIGHGKKGETRETLSLEGGEDPFFKGSNLLPTVASSQEPKKDQPHLPLVCREAVHLTMINALRVDNLETEIWRPEAICAAGKGASSRDAGHPRGDARAAPAVEVRSALRELTRARGIIKAVSGTDLATETIAVLDAEVTVDETAREREGYRRSDDAKELEVHRGSP